MLEGKRGVQDHFLAVYSVKNLNKKRLIPLVNMFTLCFIAKLFGLRTL